MSILAHVVLSGKSQLEPTATQALAYILKSSASLAKVFLQTFDSVGININLGWIESEITHEDGRPDVTVYDDTGRLRLLIENKFWAGLTKAQPVSYLKKLPDEKSALLFIVPSERITYIWHELKDRCAKAEFDLGQESPPGNVRWIPVDRRMLLITSWEHILKELKQRARSERLDDMEQDIIQLQGLAKQISDTAFLPLRSEELTDQALPKRLMNYFHLLIAVIGELQTDVIAGKTKAGSNDYQMGRYLPFGGRLELWLGVAPDVWQQCGITPLWCWVHTDSLSNLARAKSDIEAELLLTTFQEDTNGLYIPVALEQGVEEDRVIRHAARRVRHIASILAAYVPD